ncbi:MAG: LpxI family protein [Phycisphaerae bacterium]
MADHTRQRMPRLGIIAGAGRFPVMVADGARDAGCWVGVVGLRGLTDPGIAAHADLFRWSGLARLGHWLRILRRHHVDRVILAGSVRKADMFGRLRLLKLLPDWTSLRLWFFELDDKRNDAVLSAVADRLAARGITMESCVKYSDKDMAPHGVLTRRRPTPAQQRDLTFGWPIARDLGRLDIGQAIAVNETEVIAVEAIEGTDRMIERAGDLCRRGGWTLIKVAKPQQDMRFDVPTIGPDTIATLRRCGARMLVIEAGQTLIVDRDATIAAADAAGIVIVGHAEPAP